MQLPILKGQQITVRRLKRSDCESLYKHLKDQKVLRFLVSVPNPYRRKYSRPWVNWTHRAARADTDYHFGIEHNLEHEIIGGISLSTINHVHHKAELGYWLAHRHWRKGYMYEAVGLVCDFGFNQLQLHRIYAHVMNINRASAALLEKHGFIREGILRKSIRHNNRWHDMYVFAKLRGE
ncbi:MAG: GNAT family N-acetyltransferase [candidate division Zixibacteria bacterium]|nr:GNAT family N-acetyltransferase [candidate division Zixibacteria bacterium]